MYYLVPHFLAEENQIDGDVIIGNIGPKFHQSAMIFALLSDLHISIYPARVHLVYTILVNFVERCIAWWPTSVFIGVYHEFVKVPFVQNLVKDHNLTFL